MTGPSWQSQAWNWGRRTWGQVTKRLHLAKRTVATRDTSNGSCPRNGCSKFSEQQLPPIGSKANSQAWSRDTGNEKEWRQSWGKRMKRQATDRGKHSWRMHRMKNGYPQSSWNSIWNWNRQLRTEQGIRAQMCISRNVDRHNVSYVCSWLLSVLKREQILIHFRAQKNIQGINRKKAVAKGQRFGCTSERYLGNRQTRLMVTRQG